MKQYVIRNEKNQMVAVIGKNILNRFITDLTGFWRGYKMPNGRTVNCFEVEEDCGYGVGIDESLIRLYLWKGYLIVEKV